MQKGEQVLLTDGKGRKAIGVLKDDNRKKCIISVDTITTEGKKIQPVAIGMSLVKNTARMEWFLEKATEIGVSQIIPLICERTIREKFRMERMEQILISAMLQSQQCWLPQLHEPTTFLEAVQMPFTSKYIAYCEEKTQVLQPGLHSRNTILLVGPEGDFSPAEIKSATDNGFQTISLGPTRLRTETAAMAAAVLLCIRHPNS